MKFSNNIPVYLQITALLKDRILKGEYSPGSKLPSVRDLGKELKVNPNTVQRAYGELEKLELIERKKNSGSIVTYDKSSLASIREQEAESTILNFYKHMKNLGFNKSEIISRIEKLVEE